MKLFLHRLLASLAVVVLWRLLLQLALTYFTHQALDIQFPYYDTDLTPFYTRLQAVWAHFDGVHYLRLAARGYQDTGTQAFFPLYPRLIALLTPLFPSALFAAQFLSLASLTLALTGLSYLFPTHNSRFIILNSLLFPTSFFFAAVYTEPLFLALSVWFFYFLKNNEFLPAAVLAAFASATRLPGLFLTLSLLVSLGPRPRYYPLILLSASGFLAYSYFLWRQFGDPFLYFHVQPLFGAQRSGSELVLLPQVLWRYLRMLMTTSPVTWLWQRVLLEFVTFLAGLLLLVKNWPQLSPPLRAYLTLALVLPTLTGTLSSYPRYLLVLWPFLLAPRSRPRPLTLLASSILGLGLLGLFVRGWFVA